MGARCPASPTGCAVQGVPKTEGVTQDVFMRLWQMPERYPSERGTPFSFLNVQAHGRAVDRLRCDTARRKRELTSLGSDKARDMVEDEVLANLACEQIREMLAELPDIQRRSIVLAYFEGYTDREVANCLDLPEGTVKSRIRSGLAQLR